MIKISGILLSCIVFFTCCAEPTGKSCPAIMDKSFQQTTKIVLIFNLVNPLETKSFKEGRTNFSYLPKISYGNEEFIEIFLNPLPKDT